MEGVALNISESITVQQYSQNEIQFSKRGAAMVNTACTILLDSPESMIRATDMVSRMKAHADAVDAERKAILKPFQEGIDGINLRFNSIIKPLQEAARALGSRMLVYKQEQDRIAREAQRKAAEEAAKLREETEKKNQEIATRYNVPVHTLPAVPVAPLVHTPVAYKGTGGASFGSRKTWTFDVEDILALAQARPDLIQVNEAAIRKEIIASKGAPIKGLKVYQKETAVIK